MTAEEVREEVLSWIKHAPKLNGCAIPSAGERGVVTGLLNKELVLGDDLKIANMRRHQVLAWIFRDLLGKPNASGISAKELTDEMWWALIKWIEPKKDQDSGAWIGHNGFSDSIIACWKVMDEWQRAMDGQLGFLDLV